MINNGQAGIWEVIIWRQIGVILHQPLNLSIFRKKRENGQIMNGPPVCLGQKTENAPTWRPRKHNFRTRFCPYFARYFEAANVHFQPITTIILIQLYVSIFYYQLRSNKGKPTPNQTLTLDPNTIHHTPLPTH